MTAPRNLKQAIAVGYVLRNIYNPQGPKCRVDLVERSHVPGRAAFVSFWLARAYLVRQYPQWAQRFM